MLNVKIALSKLLKKIISNKEAVLFNDISIHHSCQILIEQNNRTIKDIFENCNIQKNNIFPQDNNDINFEYCDNSYFKEEFNNNIQNDSGISQKDESNFEEESKDVREKSEDLLIKKIKMDNINKSSQFNDAMKTKTYNDNFYNNQKELFDL